MKLWTPNNELAVPRVFHMPGHTPCCLACNPCLGNVIPSYLTIDIANHKNDDCDKCDDYEDAWTLPLVYACEEEIIPGLGGGGVYGTWVAVWRDLALTGFTACPDANLTEPKAAEIIIRYSRPNVCSQGTRFIYVRMYDAVSGYEIIYQLNEHFEDPFDCTDFTALDIPYLSYSPAGMCLGAASTCALST